ncbi:MAG: MFS transporter [Alphaproteobacteria bacterium]|nr:MFS transporter [Alphaproteobacteria bacterium]
MGAHFLQALGFSSMVLLPPYLETLGADRSTIGAVMATAAVGGLVTRPIVGWALDRVGRKPTLTAGTLLLVAGMLLLGGVDRVGPLVIVARLLAGAGVGTLFTGYFTLASDLVPEARRTEGLALFGVSGLVPLVVNPLATRLGVDASGVRWFLPLVGGAILLSLLLLRGVPEVRAHAAQARPSLAEVGAALRRRGLWSVWVADAVFSSLVATFMAFCLVVAGRAGIPQAADLWFAYALGASGVRLLGATLPSRLGPSRVLAAALLCYVGAIALLGASADRATLLASGLLAGVGHGYAFPVLTAQVVTRAPLALRGSAMSMFTGLWDTTKLLAPPALGLAADRWGDGVMLDVAAAAALGGCVVWAALEVGVASLPESQAAG